MRRSSVSRKKSRRLFKKTAVRTHRRNLHSHPMRGGFRI